MTRIQLALIALGVSGCWIVAGVDDFTDAEPGTSGPSAGGGTTTAGGVEQGGGGLTTGGGFGAAGGSGGGGGDGGLIDTELVVRYYMDEAASGQTPAELGDAAPSVDGPVDLPITYDSELAYTTELGGNRGLLWAGPGSAGRACASVIGTKVESMLQGSTVATLEAVVVGDTVEATVQRIMQIAPMDPDESVLLMGGETSSGRLKFELNTPTAESTALWDAGLFDVGATSGGVVHVVLDSSQTDPADRVKAYVDGVFIAQGPAGPEPLVPPALDEEINFSGNAAQLCIGGRPDGVATWSGTIFYVAIYATAFTDGDIAHNVAALTINDDEP